MIAVLSATNRPNSKTRIIADYYYNTINDIADEDVKFYSLEDVSGNILHADMYLEAKQEKGLAKVQDDIFTPSTKWIIVMPEYNGSYPGILKLFLDAMSIRNYAQTFKSKKLALVGVASGRAGNLRGMDALSNSMNYLGFTVMPHKLPIPLVKSKTDNHSITDEETRNLISSHAASFVNF